MFQAEPWTIKADTGNGTFGYTGVLIELMNSLAEFLNFEWVQAVRGVVLRKDFNGSIKSSVTCCWFTDAAEQEQMTRPIPAEGGLRCILSLTHWTDSWGLKQLRIARSHCSYSVGEPADGQWGGVTPNGTWTGMIGEVQRQASRTLSQNIDLYLEMRKRPKTWRLCGMCVRAPGLVCRRWTWRLQRSRWRRRGLAPRTSSNRSTKSPRALSSRFPRSKLWPFTFRRSAWVVSLILQRNRAEGYQNFCRAVRFVCSLFLRWFEEVISSYQVAQRATEMVSTRNKSPEDSEKVKHVNTWFLVKIR